MHTPEHDNKSRHKLIVQIRKEKKHRENTGNASVQKHAPGIFYFYPVNAVCLKEKISQKMRQQKTDKNECEHFSEFLLDPSLPRICASEHPSLQPSNLPTIKSNFIY
jgi:hypothetical protein